MIRRPPRSTRVRSSAASDVYKRQCVTLAVLTDPPSNGAPMDAIAEFFSAVSGIVWGPFLLIPLLLGTGLYLTIRLGGVQFRTLGSALRLGLVERKDKGAEGTADISQYQALTTAL